MAHNKVPLTIHITPGYYNDKGHFWSRLNLAKRFHEDHQKDLLVLVSYKFFKPNITSKQVDHYRETLRYFPHVAVIHARGVKWNDHDQELIAMGIPIYEEEYTGNL